MEISEKKKEKISEQILAYLYSISPKSSFTSHIANEIVRDEEFTKKLLLGLRKKGMVVPIKKNQKGKEYIKRTRWTLSESIYKAYRSKQ